MLHGCVNKRTCPHARMHTQVCSLTQSSSGDWVQSAQPSVMLLLQPPQRREETQLREWTQALRFFFGPKFHAFFSTNLKCTTYGQSHTVQLVCILQSSAFDCLFIWRKVCFMITVKWNAVCEHVQALGPTSNCELLDSLPLPYPENTCLIVSLPVCHLDLPPLFNTLRMQNKGVLVYKGGGLMCLERSSIELWQVDNTWMNNSNWRKLAESVTRQERKHETRE